MVVVKSGESRVVFLVGFALICLHHIHSRLVAEGGRFNLKSTGAGFKEKLTPILQPSNSHKGLRFPARSVRGYKASSQ